MGSEGSLPAISDTQTSTKSMWLMATILSIIVVSILAWRFSPFRFKIVLERKAESLTPDVTDWPETARLEGKWGVVAETREKRPFKFRGRLWNEPPELDYTSYEFYDEAQKEFKNDGKRDLEWRTRWLDLKIENNLVRNYRAWTVSQERRKRLSEKEKGFYRALLEELY